MGRSDAAASRTERPNRARFSAYHTKKKAGHGSRQSGSDEHREGRRIAVVLQMEQGRALDHSPPRVVPDLRVLEVVVQELADHREGDEG